MLLILNPLAQFFGVISAAIGSVLLVIGIGYLVMFLGLLKGRGWAWTITIILLLIGIAIQMISTATGALCLMHLLAVAATMRPIQLFQELLVV